MEKEIAVVGIIVEDLNMVPEINDLLSEYGNSILGRMGLPCHEKSINIITVVVEEREEVIAAFIEKLQSIKGVDVKAGF